MLNYVHLLAEKVMFNGFAENSYLLGLKQYNDRGEREPEQ